MLCTRNLNKSFGSLVVAQDIALSVPRGERYALIGPNGAGKTTLINLITGMLRPDAGKILLGDADITAFKPDARVKRGLARFGGALDEAFSVLKSLGLDGAAHRPTRELAYGQQRLLEIALALATRPRVLLLDEPAAGVPRGESAELFDAISGLSSELTVLFIEHDMNVVFRFASRIIVMVGGRILVEGAPGEISRDQRVREVYLGKRQHAAAH